MVETFREKTARSAVPPARRLIHVLNYDDLLTQQTQSFPITDAVLPLTLGRATAGPLRINGRRLETVDGWLSTNHAEISERDERDANRADAPMKPAPDAILFDTSDLSITEVVAGLARMTRERTA